MTTTSDDWRPTSGGRSLVALVPDYDGVTDGNQKSVLRLGAYDPTDEASIFSALDDGWKAVSNGDKKVKDLLLNKSSQPFPGWLEYTDGDRTVVAKGSVREAIEGDYTLYVGGNVLMDVGGKWEFRIGSGTVETWNADPVYYIEFFKQEHTLTAGKSSYRKREMGHVSADSYWFGDMETFYAGFKFDATMGLTMAAFLGGKIDVNAALSASFTFGYAIELGAVYKYSNVLGKDMHVADDLESKAHTSLHLRVKATADGISKALKASAKANIGAAVVAAVAAGVAGSSTAIPPVTSSGIAPVAITGLSLGGIGFIAALAWSLHNALKENAAPKLSASELKMDATSILLRKSDATGATMESMLEMKTGAGPGMTTLENITGSYVQLGSNGHAILEAAQDVVVRNAGGTASIWIQQAGDIRVKATTSNVDGRLYVGPGGTTLRVG
jgi:hypothetical protein